MISVVSVDTVAIYHGVDISKRFPRDAGWMRHAVGAVIHRMCRQAHNKKDVVLPRNARWVTQKVLTLPASGLK
jgi:hypothetical protein